MPRFEVRCHEWGDDSDYHWAYCNSRKEAQNIVDENSNLYERLYYIEVDDKNNPIPPTESEIRELLNMKWEINNDKE